MTTLLAQYTWNPKTRQYIGADGRFVRRKQVKDALEQVIEVASDDIEAIAHKLQDGKINLSEWFNQTAAKIKVINVASAAVAVGGTHALTPSILGSTGARIKTQYEFLRNFAHQIENGLKLDGAFIARARLYGRSGRPTFEAIARKGDIAAGFKFERRILHPVEHCDQCIDQADMGWQEAGVLLPIGECTCMNNCRCTFERSRTEPLAGFARGSRMSNVTFAKGGGGIKSKVKAPKGVGVPSGASGPGMGEGFNGTVAGKKGFAPGNKYGSLHGEGTGGPSVKEAKAAHKEAHAVAGKHLERHASQPAGTPLSSTARQAIRDAATASRNLQQAKAVHAQTRASKGVTRASKTNGSSPMETRVAQSAKVASATKVRHATKHIENLKAGVHAGRIDDTKIHGYSKLIANGTTHKELHAALKNHGVDTSGLRTKNDLAHAITLHTLRQTAKPSPAPTRVPAAVPGLSRAAPLSPSPSPMQARVADSAKVAEAIKARITHKPLGRGTLARNEQAAAYKSERAQGVRDGFARATEGGGRLRGVGGPQPQSKIAEARFTPKRKARAEQLRSIRGSVTKTPEAKPEASKAKTSNSKAKPKSTAPRPAHKPVADQAAADAAFRRAHGLNDTHEVHPTAKASDHATTAGTKAEAIPQRSDLKDFADRVVKGAHAAPTGGFGDEKTMISHVKAHLDKTDPAFRSMSDAEFKSKLIDAHKAGHLELGRADLFDAMNPHDLRASDTPYLNANFHFVRHPGAPGKKQSEPEPSKPASNSEHQAQIASMQKRIDDLNRSTKAIDRANTSGERKFSPADQSKIDAAHAQLVHHISTTREPRIFGHQAHGILNKLSHEQVFEVHQKLGGKPLSSKVEDHYEAAVKHAKSLHKARREGKS
jgi:hypothetical protein